MQFGIDKKIGDWSNSEYQKQLSESEILAVARHFEQLKNPARDQEVVNADGVINPDSILLVHATNFPPSKEGDSLVINSSGNADPKHEALRRREDNYKKYAGLPNMRFTIHFGMPGSYASHQKITEEGKINYDALAESAFLIVLPIGDTLRLPENKLCNLNPTDTFFWDKVYLPEGTIIIAQQKGAESLLLRRKDFDRYQIAVSDKLPIQAFKNLLENEEFESAIAAVEALGNAFVTGKRPRLDSQLSTIALSLNDSQHSDSIFHDLERMPLFLYERKFTDSENAEMIQDAQEKEHIKITDENKFVRLEDFLQSINRFYFQAVRTLDRIAKLGAGRSEEMVFIQEGEDMRRAIIEKIRPWLGQGIEKLANRLKENLVDPFECIQDTHLPFDAFFKRFKEARQAKEAMESNELLQHEFPQTRAVIGILDEFLSHEVKTEDYQKNT